MGDARVTTQSLQIVSTDTVRGLLLIKGAVPGSENSYVLIKDSVKRKPPADLPFPAALRGDNSGEPAAETGEEAAP
jgi:large subunit ribosomal protein L3